MLSLKIIISITFVTVAICNQSEQKQISNCIVHLHQFIFTATHGSATVRRTTEMQLLRRHHKEYCIKVIK